MYARLLQFNNVSANQLATLDLLGIVKGRVIDRVDLFLGGTTFTKAMIGNITVKANAKIIWQDSADRTDKRMQERGHAASAGCLSIDFTEARLKDMYEELLGGLDTGANSGISTLQMEVEILGATAPTLQAFADTSWQSTQVEGGVDKIGKTLNFPHQVTATNAKFPLQIPYGKQGGSLIKRINLVPPAGIVINGFEVRKNSIPVFDRTMAANNFVLSQAGRVPQATWFTCDFIEGGSMTGNVLNAAEAETMEYYVDVTVTTPGNIQVVVDMLDPLANN